MRGASNTIFCISKILTSFFYSYFRPIRNVRFITLEKLTDFTDFLVPLIIVFVIITILRTRPPIITEMSSGLLGILKPFTKSSKSKSKLYTEYQKKTRIGAKIQKIEDEDDKE